jgi:hypothetical protein
MRCSLVEASVKSFFWPTPHRRGSQALEVIQKIATCVLALSAAAATTGAILIATHYIVPIASIGLFIAIAVLAITFLAQTIFFAISQASAAKPSSVKKIGNADRLKAAADPKASQPKRATEADLIAQLLKQGISTEEYNRWKGAMKLSTSSVEDVMALTDGEEFFQKIMIQQTGSRAAGIDVECRAIIQALKDSREESLDIFIDYSSCSEDQREASNRILRLLSIGVDDLVVWRDSFLQKHSQNFERLLKKGRDSLRLERAARLGNQTASLFLAFCHITRLANNPDPREAYQHLQKCGDSNGLAMYERAMLIEKWGRAHLQRDVWVYEHDKDNTWELESASKLGNSLATQTLALKKWLPLGDKVPTEADIKKIKESLELAVSQKSMGSFYFLGRLCLMGATVPDKGVDPTSEYAKQAFNYFRQAVDNGCYMAINSLIFCYKKEIGTPRNEGQIKELTERLTEEKDRVCRELDPLAFQEYSVIADSAI